jgi:hypothetical protein
MREYEQQWSRASGHGVRHPLRLKMSALEELSAGPDVSTPTGFTATLDAALKSDEPGAALLAAELRPLWAATLAGDPLPFGRDD